MKDMAARNAMGIKKYGTPLQPHNGRNSLQDAYEEALDLAVYLKNAIIELEKTTMKIKFKRLDKKANIPRRATEGSAGFDVFSNGHYTIKPNVRCLLDTGIAMQLPNGYWGELKPRSGLAAKHGLDVLAGVIDADYTGEIKVSLINLGEHDVEIKAGDRIAQLIIQRYESDWMEVEEFDDTERGAGGFGSTGK